MSDKPPINSADPAWPPIKRWMLHQRFKAVEELKIVGLSDALANAARGKIELADTLIAQVEPRAVKAELVDSGTDYNDD